MARETHQGGIRIELLGGFHVAAGQADLVTDGWPGRRAGELVALSTGTA